MAENKINVQKYAMHFGTYMGVYWIFKFAFLPLGFTNVFFFLLFIGLTLGVPFMGYRYTRLYRDKVCGGEIGFLQSWAFMVFMYLFAALLTAVGHYIYFRFIDNGFITTQMLNSLSLQEQLPGMEIYKAQVENAKSVVDLLRSMSAIEITMQLLSQNMLYCSILALVTAPFVMKKKSVFP